MVEARETYEWTLPRSEGDLTCFAATAEDAVLTMAEHGFPDVDPSLLRRSEKRLSDVLRPIDAEHQSVESERVALGLKVCRKCGARSVLGNGLCETCNNPRPVLLPKPFPKGYGNGRP